MLLCVTAHAALAQSARFSGQVSDPQNAAIVNAEVRVVNLDSLVERVARTDAAGAYSVPYLPAGRYQIAAQVPGFNRTQSPILQLAIGQTLVYNIQRTVGGAQSNVTVLGETNVGAQVDTSNAEVSGAITGREVTSLGLNGRNFTQFIALVPGVSNQTQQDEAKVGVLGSVAYSVNGGRTEYNSFQVDGAETLNVCINKDHSTLIVYPSVDAIQEITRGSGADGPQHDAEYLLSRRGATAASGRSA